MTIASWFHSWSVTGWWLEVGLFQFIPCRPSNSILAFKCSYIVWYEHTHTYTHPPTHSVTVIHSVLEKNKKWQLYNSKKTNQQHSNIQINCILLCCLLKWHATVYNLRQTVMKYLQTSWAILIRSTTTTTQLSCNMLIYSNQGEKRKINFSLPPLLSLMQTNKQTKNCIQCGNTNGADCVGYYF